MSSKTSKVGVIGAGNVGANVANALVLLRKCVRVVLFDRTLSKAQGQAWDIEDSIPLLEEMEIIPSNKYEDLADEHGDSEFVVWSSAFIGGIPLAEFPIPQGETLEQIQQEYAELTRKRG